MRRGWDTNKYSLRTSKGCMTMIWINIGIVVGGNSTENNGKS